MNNKPMSLFEDWWESVGSKMKNEPGENINDTELPLRIAKAAWGAGSMSSDTGRGHLSSCAVYNEPAYPKGNCNCGWEGIASFTKNLNRSNDNVYEIKNHVLVKFESSNEDEVGFAREWAEVCAPGHVKKYVDYEMVPHHNDVDDHLSRLK